MIWSSAVSRRDASSSSKSRSGPGGSSGEASRSLAAASSSSVRALFLCMSTGMKSSTRSPIAFTSSENEPAWKIVRLLV